MPQWLSDLAPILILLFVVGVVLFRLGVVLRALGETERADALHARARDLGTTNG